MTRPTTIKPGDAFRVVQAVSAGNEYKHGDIVYFVKEYVDATLSDSGLFSHKKVGNLFTPYIHWSELEPYQPVKTFETLQVGDLVQNEYGNYRRVLGVCGEVYLLSSVSEEKKSDHLKRGGSFFTVFELKEDGFTIIQDTPQPENKDFETTTWETMTILDKTYRKADVERWLEKLEEL